MEEILPAARLLSQATAVTPSDYEHAKAVFLEHVQSAGAAAENLRKQAFPRPVCLTVMSTATTPAQTHAAMSTSCLSC